MFALNRQGKQIRLATIREDGKIEYKENIPKTFVDGDILLLLACEPGIDRAKELEKAKKKVSTVGVSFYINPACKYIQKALDIFAS